MDSNWLASRPHLAPVVSKMTALLELADAMVQQSRASGESVDYDAFEEAIAKRTAEVESAVHEAALSSLDIDAPFVRVWGKDYRRVHRAERTYGTLAGPVTVDRTLYREVGVRNGPTLDVVAQRAGIVDRRWLPRAARAMAHLLAQGTSREAQATSAELLRLPYSRSSFERVGHAVGAAYIARRTTIEAALIEATEVPPQAVAISVAVDRVAVPMEEDAPEQTDRRATLSPEEQARVDKVRPPVELDPRVKAALKEMERASAEAEPRIVERNYRMAYCATVSLHDGKGEAIHTLRYGRMPPAPDSIDAITHRDVHRLMERLRDDVCALRAKRPDLNVVLLADGAPELWRLFERFLNESTIGAAPTELVDAWHALEYVAAACRLLEQHGRWEPGSYRQCRQQLIEKPGGAEALVQSLRAAGLQHAQDESGGQPVRDAIRYIEGRLARMNYAAARERGLPIGSGTVEATCKTLVSVRMKRAGSRWKSKTGNEVLQLRALQTSDRWDSAMRRTLKPLRKSVQVIDRSAAARRASWGAVSSTGGPPD